MANLGSLRVFLTADTKKYQSGLSRAQKMTRGFARGVGRATAVLGGFAAAGIGAFAILDRMATVGDDIGKGAKKIGVTAEEFQKLEFAAERSGANISNVQAAFKRMGSAIFDAENGLMESKRAFAALNIELSDLRGLSPEKQFAMIAEQLTKVSDGSTRAALAQDVFGRGGMELIPMVRDYKALADEAERIGLITNENVKAAERWKDAIKNISQAATSFVQNSGLLQYMTDVVEEADALIRMLKGEDFDPSFAAPTDAERAAQQAGAKARRAAAAEKAAQAEAMKNMISESTIQDLIKLRQQIERRDEERERKSKDIADQEAKAIAEAVDSLNWKRMDDPVEEEKRLAEALQAGSREAFNLRTRTISSKMEKANLKANQMTANDIRDIVTNGITLKSVGIVERV